MIKKRNDKNKIKWLKSNEWIQSKVKWNEYELN